MYSLSWPNRDRPSLEATRMGGPGASRAIGRNINRGMMCECRSCAGIRQRRHSPKGGSAARDVWAFIRRSSLQTGYVVQEVYRPTDGGATEEAEPRGGHDEHRSGSALVSGPSGASVRVGRRASRYSLSGRPWVVRFARSCFLDPVVRAPSGSIDLHSASSRA